jgi:nitrogen fixation-related uncharacterized protein
MMEVYFVIIVMFFITLGIFAWATEREDYED